MNTPLLHEVIPISDILTDDLDNTAHDETLPGVVRLAAGRGLKILNKYYAKTDEGIMHRLAMSAF